MSDTEHDPNESGEPGPDFGIPEGDEPLGEPEPDADDPDDDPDNDPDEPQHGDDPEGEPEPVADEPQGRVVGVTPEEAERIIGKAEKRAAAYMTRTPDQLGPLGEELVPCPLCLPFAPGFIFDPVAIQVAGDQKAAVLDAIGEGEQAQFKQADNARQCDSCEGLGAVLSGSRVAQFRTVGCRKCKGRGFLGVVLDGEPEPVVPELAVVTFNGDGEGEPLPDADPWGRLPDHPMYGVMPMFEEQRRQREAAAL